MIVLPFTILPDGSTFLQQKWSLNGFKLCNRLCMTCAPAGIGPQDTIKTHKCMKTNQEWKITAPLTCESCNVIYRITCLKCPHWTYIGETRRRFSDRLTDHRGYVNRGETQHPVGHHFSQGSHTLADLRAIPIERVFPTENDHIRKTRESLWITRYDSISFGGNTRN